MNEELDSQLSAMFDDELPESQCELLAKRLARDDALKARWGRYAVIGAAIRAERGVRLDAGLAHRVSAALAVEPSLVSEPAAASHKFPARVSRRWWQPVGAVAAAASVAVVSIMWLRWQSASDGLMVAQSTDSAVVVQDAAQSTTAAGSEPDSYTVPASVEPPAIVPTAELAKYVVAHSEYLAPVSRRNVLSALVASESGPFNDRTDDAQ